jgi:hypothetical protein
MVNINAPFSIKVYFCKKETLSYQSLKISLVNSDPFLIINAVNRNQNLVKVNVSIIKKKEHFIYKLESIENKILSHLFKCSCRVTINLSFLFIK